MLDRIYYLQCEIQLHQSVFSIISRQIIIQVQTIVDHESSQGGKNIPEWIHGRPNTGTGLVAYRHNSSYMADFKEDLLVNFEDMKQNASKTGSTRDLFVGTSKDTFQLAGYSGHIPANTNNAKKALHSKGENMRPQPCYLRLVSERIGSVPSYSGITALDVVVFCHVSREIITPNELAFCLVYVYLV